MNKLNILVFDNNPYNLRAAEITLKGHSLTLVSCYDEMQKELTPYIDKAAVRQKLKEQFKNFDPSRLEKDWDIKMAAYRATEIKLNRQHSERLNFDIVLTDLMAIPSSQHQRSFDFKRANTKLPLGPIIALLAISYGVKRVAIVSDEDYHGNPAAAALACFPGVGGNETKVLCTCVREHLYMDAKTGEVIDENFLYTDEGYKKYPRTNNGIEDRIHLRRTKNWTNVLKELIEE